MLRCDDLPVYLLTVVHRGPHSRIQTTQLLILKPVGFRHVVSDRETLRVGFVSMTTLPSIHVGKCELMGGKQT